MTIAFCSARATETNRLSRSHHLRPEGLHRKHRSGWQELREKLGILQWQWQWQRREVCQRGSASWWGVDPEAAQAGGVAAAAAAAAAAAVLKGPRW